MSRLRPRLLERFATTPGWARADAPEPAIVQSVLRHVSALLAARPGLSPAAPELGLPDLAAVAFALPDALASFAQAIARTIERYEPRLCEVRVAPRDKGPSPLVMELEIRARLVESQRRMCLLTAVDWRGRARVLP
jgi:type VI secretion system protein